MVTQGTPGECDICLAVQRAVWERQRIEVWVTEYLKTDAGIEEVAKLAREMMDEDPRDRIEDLVG